jgi:hypothetical protein
MTDHAPRAGSHEPHVRSEEDRISTARIVAVGVASLVVFLLAGVATWKYWEATHAHRGLASMPPEVGSSKIGMVEQQLFEKSRRGALDRAARQERLRSYGWVDRRQGVVHLPIDRAMELVVEGARPAPGAAPEPPRPPGGQP